MKTITSTTSIYSFNELMNTAKTAAIDNVREYIETETTFFADILNDIKLKLGISFDNSTVCRNELKFECESVSGTVEKILRNKYQFPTLVSAACTYKNKLNAIVQAQTLTDGEVKKAVSKISNEFKNSHANRNSIVKHFELCSSTILSTQYVENQIHDLGIMFSPDGTMSDAEHWEL